MDELQAAFCAKIQRLDSDNESRRRIASLYLARLAGTPTLVLPNVDKNSHPVWHLFVVRSPQREALIRALSDDGIQTLMHYPVAPYNQPAYAGDSPRQDLDVSDMLASEVLSLPIGPTVSLETAAHVATRVRQHMTTMGR